MELEHKIVVLLTVYNRKSVYKTIESVLNQSFGEFQLLIVDNASDDGTYELIQSYADKDQRVKIVRNEKNMGQTYSLHRGMELANGKYIARIDADDIMTKDRLKKQYEFLENNPEYGFCGSWVQFITDDDKLTMVIKMPTSDTGLRLCQRIICGMYHPAVMMRKSVLQKYNIMYDKNLKMAEDYDMWRQLLLVSKGRNLPEVLLYYRRGLNNDSDANRATTNKEEVLVRDKVCNEENYLGKELVLYNISVEKKTKKSFVEYLRAKKNYKKVLNMTLTKKDEDYSIVKKRIRSHLIGLFYCNNPKMWAKIGYFFYRIIRKIAYLL